MGGFGSGRCSRSTQMSWDELMRLDARDLYPALLQPCTTATAEWDGASQSYGSLTITPDTLDGEQGFWLRHEVTALHWSDPHKSMSFVEAEATPCQYGGQRYWLTCPYCRTRRRVIGLYVYANHHSRWGCRGCLPVPYKSQQLGKHQQAMRQSSKIERLLDEDDDGYLVKPKHMHWQTFERLLDKRYRYEQVSEDILIMAMGAFMHRAGNRNMKPHPT